MIFFPRVPVMSLEILTCLIRYLNSSDMIYSQAKSVARNVVQKLVFLIYLKIHADVLVIFYITGCTFSNAFL